MVEYSVVISARANFGLIAIMASGHTLETSKQSHTGEKQVLTLGKSKYSHWRKISIHTGEKGTSEKQSFGPECCFTLKAQVKPTSLPPFPFIRLGNTSPKAISGL